MPTLRVSNEHDPRPHVASHEYRVFPGEGALDLRVNVLNPDPNVRTFPQPLHHRRHRQRRRKEHQRPVVHLWRLREESLQKRLGVSRAVIEFPIRGDDRLVVHEGIPCLKVERG